LSFVHSNTEGENLTSQSTELFRQAIVLLEKLTQLDPEHKSEHLARLDHLMGFSSASSNAPGFKSIHKADLLAQGEAAGLNLNPKLVEEINSSEHDAVEFAILALIWKSKQEYVSNPNGYFLAVLKDQQSKRKKQQQAI